MFQLLEVAHITDMGKLPAGLANYLAKKGSTPSKLPLKKKGKKQSNPTMKASRKHTKPTTKPVAKPYNFLAMQKKLGVVR